MGKLIDKLKEGRVLICDGAMGTQLQEKGLGTGECPDIWNLTYPEVVSNIHQAYLKEGAELIITNTFGATRFKLSRFGKEDEVGEINRAGARIAKDIAEDKVLVLGDIGPTGELLEPAGSFKVEDLYKIFKEQVKALIEGGVDAIIIETMSDLEEAKAAVRAAKENSELDVVACMSFQKGKHGYKTMMGVSIEDAVKGLEAAGCDVVGSNCGIGSGEMIDVIHRMRRLTKLPLIAQPNAGLPRLVEGKTMFDESPEYFARNILKLVKREVHIVGGCCGTTPQHIAAIKSIIRRDG